MGFMEAYKRLEKLCGEVMDDDRRIGAYIEEMKNTPRGAFYVRGWDKDLNQLKHCCWVRNQIAHNPERSEDNMCDPEDTLWLSEFYARIMNQTDPLALYRKATQVQKIAASHGTAKKVQKNHPDSECGSQDRRLGRMALRIALGILLLLAMIVVLWRLF